MNHKRVVNIKHSFYDVYIGRPSKWGNPFSHLESEIAEYKVKTRLEAVQEYAYWINTQDNLKKDLHELVGKVLGCFCAPNLCHGTVLAELADRLEEDFEKVEKVFTTEGDDLLQEVYRYLFNIREHLEIEGDLEFILKVKSIVKHLNKTRNKPIIILTEKEMPTNRITHRK